MAPEAMVVVGYGQIIPQAILDIPPHGIINVHASLLPKYRGAAPIQWAIARGETTNRRDHDADQRGARHRRYAAEVGDRDRRGGDGGGVGRAAGGGGRGFAGADAGRSCRASSRSRRTMRRPRYAPILKKEDGHIDWTLPRARDFESDSRVSRRGRAATDFCEGQFARVARRDRRIDSLRPASCRPSGERSCSRDAADGSIELLEVQLEGKKRMAAAAFLNGFPIGAGEVLHEHESCRWGFVTRRRTRESARSTKDDLALIVSDTPASAAAVFTQNRVVAGPVTVAREKCARFARAHARRFW